MKNHCILLFLAMSVLLSGLSATAAESDDTADRIKACAMIAEETARIACYESLGKETLAEDGNTGDGVATGEAESAPAVVTTGAAVAAASAPATTVPATSAPTNVPIKGERPREEYRVAVSSCQTNNVGDTYFTLDNGEVWKLTGGQQLRESDCVFSATLRKDFFGYKMLIDDDRGTVRVKRVK